MDFEKFLPTTIKGGIYIWIGICFTEIFLGLKQSENFVLV